MAPKPCRACIGAGVARVVYGGRWSLLQRRIASRRQNRMCSWTRQCRLLADRWSASRWPAVLARGDDPPEPPEEQCWLLAGRWSASRWPAVLARGDGPPEPPEEQCWLLAGRWSASRWPAVLARGDGPPEPPEEQCWLLTSLRHPGRRLMLGHDLPEELDEFLAAREHELIAFRRDLHAHPELGYHEHRTTSRVAQRLAAAGLRPAILPKGTGLIVDIGEPSAGDSLVALRADLDALPLNDEKNVPYRSTVPHTCHACGHDVHTSVLLGAGLFLAGQAAAGTLPGRVRLIFQPAEEVPGGALDVMAAGGIASVDRVFAVHCDPRLEVGKVGTRTGPITAACDKIKVRVTGPGGHTARPHLTADLVYALGKILT